ncbi:MAG: hypothetical protein FWD19_03495 [Defluviitaleaceae bacterium]|nr:hypothetical protein [Defluviitaleaceae bacterium]
MVNQQKIITMTKLALYDKRNGAADRAANEYFRHDYIYRKNLGTRIAVGIGGFLLLAIHWTSVFFVEGMDIFELDINSVMRESVLFILVIVAFYSFVGTIQGTREYHRVQKRLQKYNEMLGFLENSEPNKNIISDEKALENERRTQEARERRERRERREKNERELRAARAARNTTAADPLAHVSARAMSSGLPRRTMTTRPRDTEKRD